jgi:hypothetical protein
LVAIGRDGAAADAAGGFAGITGGAAGTGAGTDGAAAGDAAAVAEYLAYSAMNDFRAPNDAT